MMPARYDKRRSDGTWKVVNADNGWIVTMDGVPLDDLEENEADEAIRQLDAGEMTPDAPHAPPPAD